MKSEKQQVREALLVLAVVASTILLAFLKCQRKTEQRYPEAPAGSIQSLSRGTHDIKIKRGENDEIHK